MKKELLFAVADGENSTASSVRRTSPSNGMVHKYGQTQSPANMDQVENIDPNKKHESKQLELPQQHINYTISPNKPANSEIYPMQSHFCSVEPGTPVLSHQEKHQSWLNFKEKFVGKKILLREN